MASRSNGVYVAPVVFALRMAFGVAVNFAGAGQEKARFLDLGKPEAVMRSQGADLQRRDRMAQVIDGTGGRREMQNDIHRPVDFDRVGDIVPDEREAGVGAKMLDILQASGDQIIDDDDLAAIGQKSIAEMRSEEARAARYDCSHVCAPKPARRASQFVRLLVYR
jgi:hypothetical protein